MVYSGLSFVPEEPSTDRLLLIALALAASGASAASDVTSNASTRTATLVVDAGQSTAGGGLNFNGVVKGGRSFTVPAGWNVVTQFKSMGTLAHSAVMIKGTTPPVSVTEKDATFPGAHTGMVMQGLPMNAAATAKFKAATAGNYLIICGVPGPALGGQYLGLKVVAGAKAATYQ